MAALLVLNVGLGYRNTHQLSEDAGWVAHTHLVRDLTSEVLLALVDAETGQRGFLITGRDAFLQPYDAALARLDQIQVKLAEETRDNPGQQARVRKLRELGGVRLAQLKEAIALRRRSEQEARAFLATGRGKAQMDAIRHLVGEMRAAEDDLLVQRQRATDDAYKTAVATEVLTGVLGLVLFGAFVWLLERSLRTRQRAAAALQEADRRKDEFLATLAHELRNPLAPIRNSLQILRLGGADRQPPEGVVDMMERQLGYIVRLVDDLLDVSRITTGKIELRPERVEVAQVVDSALETARPALEASRHEVRVRVPPQPLYVNGDATRLAQVVANLLNNSAKYTPEGGHVGLTVEGGGGRVVFRVRDDGVGIPADMLPKVFDLFTQVDRNLQRAQGGLGIGLTLVRRLVEMHGGHVEAHSDGQDKGSEFIVTLPLAAEDPAGGRVESTPGPTARPAARRILVVDDSPDSAESLSMLLSLLGNEVRTAHDGPSALEAAKEFGPEVVLLDIGLPGMDGYEVARRLRQTPEGREAVLVAQTGWGQDEDRRRSSAAGFNLHLVKPVDFAALQKLLEGLGRGAV